MAPEGLKTRVSDYDVAETMDRLRAAVTGRGMAIVAHIDHARAAAEAGLHLRPTEVLIFGNATAGTPLMQAAPTIGIDLPLRVLVWSDQAGATWLAYNDPAWLAERHGAHGAERVLGAMSDALAAVADQATGRQPGAAE